MLTNFLLQFALIGAEWVLWVLVILSFINGYIIIERLAFYWKRSVDGQALRQQLEKLFRSGEFSKAADVLKDNDAMEARVVLFGLREWERGPEAVEDLMELKSEAENSTSSSAGGGATATIQQRASPSWTVW